MIVRNDIITEANLVQQSFIGNRLALDALNPASYPGSGNKWYDLSGNNNTITLFNEPTYSNGALTFNGTTQYGSRTSTPSLNIDGPSISLEVWFNLNTFTDTVFASKAPYNGGPNYQNGNYSFWTGPDFTIFVSQDDTASKPNFLRIDSPGGVSSGNWYQFVITYNNPYAYYYLNGSLVARLPRYGDNVEYGYNDLFRTSSDFRITGRPDGYGFIDGSISVMNLFDYALTEDQVLYNYNFYSQRYI